MKEYIIIYVGETLAVALPALPANPRGLHQGFHPLAKRQST